MPSFNAATTVKPLDYNFLTVEGGKGRGIIPEPTQKQIEDFVAGFQELVKDLRAQTNGEVSEENAEEAMTHMRDLRRRSTEIVSELCSGQPSVEEIESLPPRLQSAFAKWVRQEITDPNVESGATGR